MEKYKIKIKLLTDAIFGSGYSVPGYIDSDILYDELGFPYINGKTLKGKIGEMASVFTRMLKSFNGCEEFSRSIEVKKDKLFGIEGSVDSVNTLKFSDCEISKDLRNYFNLYKSKSNINQQEIIEALTHLEVQTSIDYTTGIAKENSLRNFRVINRGIVLYSNVYTVEELDEEEKILIASSCSLLRHLGSYETKGKGEVSSSLYYDGKNVTNDYIKLLEKKVNVNV